MGTQFIGCCSELCAEEHTQIQLPRPVSVLNIFPFFGAGVIGIIQFMSIHIDSYRLVSFHIDLIRNRCSIIQNHVWVNTAPMMYCRGPRANAIRPPPKIARVYCRGHPIRIFILHRRSPQSNEWICQHSTPFHSMGGRIFAVGSAEICIRAGCKVL